MLEQRLIADEKMDDPNLEEGVYRDVLTDLGRVNEVTLAHRPTIRFLKKAWNGRSALKVLDVGFGDGGTLRAVAGAAQRAGVSTKLVGIDLNPRSEAVARAALPKDIAIDFRTGDYADLAGEGWDCVISSLVAHHMTRDQLVAFLRFMEREAQIGWFINDLHRLAFAYMGYPLLAKLMRWHPIVQHDGRMSIARSYRPDEWPPLLVEAGISEAVVERVFPFRLCVERLR